MFFVTSIVECLLLFASAVYAADILTVLRDSEATIFADIIANDPALYALYTSPNVGTILAPVDNVFANTTPSERALAIRANEDPKLILGALDKQDQASTNIAGVHNITSVQVPHNNEYGKQVAVIQQKNPAHSRRAENHEDPKFEVITGLGNTVTVVESDISYNGGYIYTIDGFLTVPTKLSTTLATLHNTTAFGELLSCNNLTSSLDTQRGGTFFIPSNDAISALGNWTLSTAGIQNHVVKGLSAYLPSLAESKTLKTASGGELTVKQSSDGAHTINGAKIISTNIILENGVAYVIDKVLTTSTPTSPYPPINSSASSSLWDSVKLVGTIAFSVVFAVAFWV
ncbi:FAS1 domain-containing protein [Bimuria novae-zelandiae CBS 107.79]|uniref:FAS1 domain-containing protein n=1 Tax=Bimuria novae-zelandiae CBS 107.79 TaxID=1447943 RepID=A0A6A5UXF1_9PLEO|nr:FAS1 domain-containing protein [Bimuria novae-zelandiae CBS 107.79]